MQNVFFSIPIQKKEQKQFVLTWGWAIVYIQSWPKAVHSLFTLCNIIVQKGLNHPDIPQNITLISYIRGYSWVKMNLHLIFMKLGPLVQGDIMWSPVERITLWPWSAPLSEGSQRVWFTSEGKQNTSSAQGTHFTAKEIEQWPCDFEIHCPYTNLAFQKILTSDGRWNGGPLKLHQLS